MGEAEDNLADLRLTRNDIYRCSLIVTRHRLRIHRVYVTPNDRIAGVLSTRDLMLLIRDNRAASPISEWMSSPTYTVRADEPVSLATERLEKAHVSGLVVMDEGWPLGVFTQVEALEARGEPRETPIDALMSPALLCLPKDTKTLLDRRPRCAFVALSHWINARLQEFSRGWTSLALRPTNSNCAELVG